MPTYEYDCITCGRRFDFVQSMNDPRLTTCPEQICDKKGEVKRRLGKGAGIIFKGSGFYETDYRSESYKEAAKKDKEPTAPAASESSKPAADASTSSTSPPPAPAAGPAQPPATPPKPSPAKPAGGGN